MSDRVYSALDAEDRARSLEAQVARMRLDVLELERRLRDAKDSARSACETVVTALTRIEELEEVASRCRLRRAELPADVARALEAHDAKIAARRA